MSTLTDIADYLVSQAILNPGEYFLSELPDDPDDVVVIYETPGLQPQFVHGTIDGPSYEHPRVQVVSRSVSYEAAKAKAQQIFMELGRIVNTSIGGVWYMRIAPVQSPYQIQRDGKDRCLIVCNFLVSKAASVG